MASRKTYLATKYDTGDRVDIDLYPYVRIKAKCRQARHKLTSAAQENCNYYTAMRMLIRKVHLNFVNGDWMIVLDYDNGWYPADEATALKDIRNFIRRLAAFYKKHGVELKYIYVTARGEETGRLHHHLIVNAVPGAAKDDIRKIWKMGKRIHMEYLEMSQLGISDLSAYMARQPDVMTRRWTSSKNLKKPEPETYFKPGKYSRFTKGDCEDFYKHNFSTEEIRRMFPGLQLTEDYEVRYNAVNGEYYLHFRFYKQNAKVAWWGKPFDDEAPSKPYFYNQN